MPEKNADKNYRIHITMCILTALALIPSYDTWLSVESANIKKPPIVNSPPPTPRASETVERSIDNIGREDKLSSVIVCKPIEDAQQKLSAIEQIESAAERNNYYPTLVRQAICNEKFDLAYEATKKISKNSTRDESLLFLVKELSAKGRVALANSAKERIKNYEIRNKATKIIGNAAL